MAQLFPRNERSFLLPRLTSNCVHVAVSSSRLEYSACLCFLRIVVPHHERDIRVYTNDGEGGGDASSFTMVARLYYDVTTCRSFLMRRSVYFSRSARDFDSNVTFSSRITWNRPSTCACICIRSRASYQKTRCHENPGRSSFYGLIINYYTCSAVSVCKKLHVLKNIHSLCEKKICRTRREIIRQRRNIYDVQRIIEKSATFLRNVTPKFFVL